MYKNLRPATEYIAIRKITTKVGVTVKPHQNEYNELSLIRTLTHAKKRA